MPHKFKVGDKVRVLPRKPEWGDQAPYYTEEMLDFEGQHATVAHVFDSGGVSLSKIYGFSWHEDWLEPAKKRKFL